MPRPARRSCCRGVCAWYTGIRPAAWSATQRGAGTSQRRRGSACTPQPGVWAGADRTRRRPKGLARAPGRQAGMFHSRSPRAPNSVRVVDFTGRGSWRGGAGGLGPLGGGKSASFTPPAKKMGKKDLGEPEFGLRAHSTEWWRPAASPRASPRASRAGRVAQPAGQPDSGDGPARFPAWLATRLATWLAPWLARGLARGLRAGWPEGWPEG